jgi:predicted PilT family ATPase
MELIIIILLLIIAAEATYLVANSGKKQINKKAGHPIFVDTSVLIDGRIIAVAQSGFLGSDTLFIPRSVIGELQFLADSGDAEKRMRARHGLDLVSELQAMPDVKVEIFQDGSKAEEGVDERLLKLAKQYNGSVCTIDYNLNKVAQVEHIRVLNVNDLAMSLRMAYLPGEKILLELTQKGQDSHQAVGHLTDGTMVVVEHANKLIGKTVEVEFIRSLQTAAGKMMFAKPVEHHNASTTNISKKIEKNTARPIKKSFVSAITRTPVAPTIVQPVSLVTPTVPVVSQTFHSDKNDQRLVNRNNQRSNQSSKPATKKFRTSAQSEDDLINMLNNQ